jgi:hypothetical protein
MILILILYSKSVRVNYVACTINIVAIVNYNATGVIYNCSILPIVNNLALRY